MAAPAAPIAGLTRDYIALTKPRIIALLLVTAIAAMVLPPRGGPTRAQLRW